MLRPAVLLALLIAAIAGAPILGDPAPASAETRTGSLDCANGFCVDVYKLKCAGGSLLARARVTPTAVTAGAPAPGTPAFQLATILAELLENASGELEGDLGGLLATVLALLGVDELSDALLDELKAILGIASETVVSLEELLAIVINEAQASQLQVSVVGNSPKSRIGGLTEVRTSPGLDQASPYAQISRVKPGSMEVYVAVTTTSSALVDYSLDLECSNGTSTTSHRVTGPIQDE